MSAPLLRIAHLEVRYGDLIGVSDVSLDVPEGSVVALLGSNGGGKDVKTRAIAFAFQVMFGTLVNALLNDPGPVSIHDSEMEERLGLCLFRLLQAEVTTTPAHNSQAEPR